MYNCCPPLLLPLMQKHIIGLKSLKLRPILKDGMLLSIFYAVGKVLHFLPNDIYITTQLLRLCWKRLDSMSGLSSMWKVLSYSVLYAFKTILNTDVV